MAIKVYIQKRPSIVVQVGAKVIGNGGAVDSVNGQTGVVVLDATDVGAYPDTNPAGYIDAAGAPLQTVSGNLVTGTSTDPMVNAAVSADAGNATTLGSDGLPYTPQGVGEIRHDFVAPFSYMGTAPSGTAETAPVWGVTRIEYLTGGYTDVKTATGAWTDRLILIYT